MAKLKPDHPRRRSLSDPLAAALLPPPNESPVQREMRLKAETEAKKVSEGIDEMIRRERSDRKRSKAEVNVLLLGQSESGKSTTLKREYCCVSHFLYILVRQSGLGFHRNLVVAANVPQTLRAA